MNDDIARICQDEFDKLIDNMSDSELVDFIKQFGVDLDEKGD